MIDAIIGSIGEFLASPFVALGYAGKQFKNICYLFLLATLVGIAVHFGFEIAFLKGTFMAFGVLVSIYSVSFAMRLR